MNRTTIEWTRGADGSKGYSVNPFRARHKTTGKVGWHCVKHSSGCAHCYSETLNVRFGTGLGYTAAAADLVELFLDPKMLASILREKRGGYVFPCDMTDLFLDAVHIEDIATFFAVMAVAHWHTFQVLTKRAERMAGIVGNRAFPALVARAIDEKVRPLIDGKIKGDWGLVSPTANELRNGRGWPLPNVWLGVSTENQKYADERIPHLLKTPAAVRFLSVEPLLGPVEFSDVTRRSDSVLQLGKKAMSGIDWVIVGGESGHDARPMHPDWARSIRDQCQAAGVPFFFKQWGEWIDAEETLADGSKIGGVRFRDWGDGRHSVWFGKKHAGRMLDGREWSEFPEPARAIETT